MPTGAASNTRSRAARSTPVLAVRVFDGLSTCCYREHVGMQKCVRELLAQPLLGLYGKLYAEAKTALEAAEKAGGGGAGAPPSDGGGAARRRSMAALSIEQLDEMSITESACTGRQATPLPVR